MLKRYTSIAISLHWLIAILLIGLIAIGKYMNELEETDHLRFELIQWHKSFGILVLLLVLIRIVWRFAHRPPRLSSKMPSWERFAASATHVFMYLLMLVIPISGWVMVSASPLNLATELFGAIPWPHLPFASAGFTDADKESVSELSNQAHHLLANGLLILVLLHIGAALRHQFVLKDNLLSRMWIAEEHRRHSDLNHALIPGVLVAAAIGLFLWDKASSQANQAATNTVNPAVSVISSVGFTAMQMGEPVNGKFDDVTIELAIDKDTVGASALNATVQTASVNTGDSQIDSTVVTGDWFASEQFPVAQFRSTDIAINTADGKAYTVTGDLTIRDVSQTVTFELSVDKGIATGEFPINRGDYGIGTGGQDEFIESEVLIRFETPQ